MVPSLRTTRWQGTTTGTGLWAQAEPTARTAAGLPDAAATAGVAGGGAVGDVAQVIEHRAAEAVGQLQVDRHVEAVPAPPAKYSSSWRATSSSRAGARRMRGLTSAASWSSTASWSSRSNATRTSPAGVAASSSGPTGLSTVR